MGAKIVSVLLLQFLPILPFTILFPFQNLPTSLYLYNPLFICFLMNAPFPAFETHTQFYFFALPSEYFFMNAILWCCKKRNTFYPQFLFYLSCKTTYFSQTLTPFDKYPSKLKMNDEYPTLS